MKRLLFIPMLFVVTFAQAQCVATVKAVSQDPIRGSIKVTTEYNLNGVVVQAGNTRYLETSGTLAEIKTKVATDIRTHCKALIRRMSVHRQWIKDRRVERQKELTDTLIIDLQDRVGGSLSVTQDTIDFKGKRINVKADGTHSITDIP